MRGLIVVNGYYKTAASVHQAERMQEELGALGAEAEIYENNRPWSLGKSFGGDFAVFFDKDAYLARALEADGIRVFNSSRATENADDKIKTQLILQRRPGLSLPDTIPAPLRYVKGIDRAFLKETAEKLGFPMVVKTARGSLGEGVFLARGFDELVALEERLSPQDRLYQKYYAGSRGESYRALIVGGKLLCAMRLRNPDDFRSNAAEGGLAERAELPKEHAEAAVAAAEALELDYCGVDLFTDGPAVIEVNAGAYFMNIERATGVNAAGAYARHILQKARS